MVTTQELIDSLQKLKDMVAEYERVLEVDPSKVVEFKKYETHGFKVTSNPMVGENLAFITDGKKQLLGWINFEDAKAYIFTEEQLKKNREMFGMVFKQIKIE